MPDSPDPVTPEPSVPDTEEVEHPKPNSQKEHWYSKPENLKPSLWEARKQFRVNVLATILNSGLLLIAFCALQRNQDVSEKQSLRDSVSGARDSVRFVSQVTFDSLERIRRDSEFVARQRYDSAHIQFLALQWSGQRRQIRAYVEFLGRSFGILDSSVTYRVENTGLTPARNVWVSVRRVIGNVSVDSTPSLDQGEFRGTLGASIVSEVVANMPSIVTWREFQQITAHGEHVYVFWRLTYSDNDGIKRRSSLRMEADAMGKFRIVDSKSD